MKNTTIVNPKVSVIMITYQHEAFITEAIEGVLMQEVDFPVELIIADDCSPDRTAEIVIRYRDTHPKGHWIQYTRHTKNKGMTPNFSWALKVAKGQFIAFCEGDDYWTDPYKLQKQVDFLEGNKNYSHCWTRFNKLWQESREVEIDGNSKFFSENKKGIDFTFKEFSTGWELGIQTLVFRKSCLPKDCFSKYKHFRDIHLITELLSQGKGFCFNSFDVVYRKHHGGVHTGTPKRLIDENAYLIYKELLEAFPSNKFLMEKLIYYLNETIFHQIDDKKFFKALQLIFKYYKFSKNYYTFKHHLKSLIFRKRL